VFDNIHLIRRMNEFIQNNTAVFITAWCIQHFNLIVFKLFPCVPSYRCLVLSVAFLLFLPPLLFGYLWNVLFLVMHTFRLSNLSARTTSFGFLGNKCANRETKTPDKQNMTNVGKLNFKQHWAAWKSYSGKTTPTEIIIYPGAQKLSHCREQFNPYLVSFS